MTVSDTHADTLITYAEHLQLTEALVADRDQARMDAADNVAAGPIGRIAKRYGWLPADEAEELRAERDRERARADQAEAAHRRVVANESNHYDRYWTPSPGPLTDEYLDETEAKMREALTDVFCDDAAAIMLTLIAEIRRLR